MHSLKFAGLAVVSCVLWGSSAALSGAAAGGPENATNLPRVAAPSCDVIRTDASLLSLRWRVVIGSYRHDRALHGRYVKSLHPDLRGLHRPIRGCFGSAPFERFEHTVDELSAARADGSPQAALLRQGAHQAQAWADALGFPDVSFAVPGEVSPVTTSGDCALVRADATMVSTRWRVVIRSYRHNDELHVRYLAGLGDTLQPVWRAAAYSDCAGERPLSTLRRTPSIALTQIVGGGNETPTLRKGARAGNAWVAALGFEGAAFTTV